MHFIDIHYTCLFHNSRIGIENHCAHHKELAIQPVIWNTLHKLEESLWHFELYVALNVKCHSQTFPQTFWKGNMYWISPLDCSVYHTVKPTKPRHIYRYENGNTHALILHYLMINASSYGHRWVNLALHPISQFYFAQSKLRLFWVPLGFFFLFALYHYFHDNLSIYLSKHFNLPVPVIYLYYFYLYLKNRV